MQLALVSPSFIRVLSDKNPQAVIQGMLC